MLKTLKNFYMKNLLLFFFSMLFCRCEAQFITRKDTMWLDGIHSNILSKQTIGGSFGKELLFSREDSAYISLGFDSLRPKNFEVQVDEPSVSIIEYGSIIVGLHEILDNTPSFYPLDVSGFLNIKECFDSVGRVEYVYKCAEDIDLVIKDACLTMKDVPFLFICDKRSKNSLAIRFHQLLTINQSREMARMVGMTYFYPYINKK